MPFYSFKVRSQGEVVLPTYMLALGEGVDVFNATVNDLDEFKQSLLLEGVEVLEVNQLDALDQVPPDPAVQAALSGRIPPELVALGYDPLIEESDHGALVQQEEALLGRAEVQPS